eukprot:m.629581 g.629581  ORF g.629581 m.629581 type:complete len:242 (-) comp58273_c0_seq32:2539-3264(-)
MQLYRKDMKCLARLWALLALIFGKLFRRKSSARLPSTVALTEPLTSIKPEPAATPALPVVTSEQPAPSQDDDWNQWFARFPFIFRCHFRLSFWGGLLTRSEESKFQLQTIAIDVAENKVARSERAIDSLFSEMEPAQATIRATQFVPLIPAMSVPASQPTLRPTAAATKYIDTQLGDMEDSEEETAWANDLEDVDTLVLEEKKKLKKQQREQREQKRKQQEEEKAAKAKNLQTKKLGIKAN